MNYDYIMYVMYLIEVLCGIYEGVWCGQTPSLKRYLCCGMQPGLQNRTYRDKKKWQHPDVIYNRHKHTALSINNTSLFVRRLTSIWSYYTRPFSETFYIQLGINEKSCCDAGCCEMGSCVLFSNSSALVGLVGHSSTPDITRKVHDGCGMLYKWRSLLRSP